MPMPMPSAVPAGSSGVAMAGSSIPAIPLPLPQGLGDDGEDDGEEGALGADGKPPDSAARLARLARKAESARLARLRHKQYVLDKQNEVSALSREEEELVAEELAASTAALVSVRQELRRKLTEEQLQAWAVACLRIIVFCPSPLLTGHAHWPGHMPQAMRIDG